MSEGDKMVTAITKQHKIQNPIECPKCHKHELQKIGTNYGEKTAYKTVYKCNNCNIRVVK